MQGRASLKAELEAKRKRKEEARKKALARLVDVSEQMAKFKSDLEVYADKHREDIARDPVFRKQFVGLARSIGVDPLASSKSIWSTKLGLGRFYFDLSVSAASICIATRPLNGGLLSLRDLTQRLIRARGSSSAASASANITEEDVSLALSKLSVLGGGYSELCIGGTRYVRSVAEALDMDGSAVLTAVEGGGGAGLRSSGGSSSSSSSSAAAAAAASAAGGSRGAAALCSCRHGLTLAAAAAALGWPRDRAARALDGLLRDGLAWLDAQSVPASYFFPSIHEPGS